LYETIKHQWNFGGEVRKTTQIRGVTRRLSTDKTPPFFRIRRIGSEKSGFDSKTPAIHQNLVTWVAFYDSIISIACRAALPLLYDQIGEHLLLIVAQLVRRFHSDAVRGFRLPRFKGVRENGQADVSAQLFRHLRMGDAHPTIHVSARQVGHHYGFLGKLIHSAG
jgi:hypothetical protein